MEGMEVAMPHGALASTIRIKCSLQDADGNVTRSKMMAFDGMGTWAAFRAAAAEKLGCAPGSHMDYIWEGCSIDEPDGRLLADILRDGDTVMLVCMSGACALSSIAAAEGSDSQPARPPTKRSPLVRMPAAAAAPCSTSVKCSCVHSRCIKMYCACWSANVLCNPASCMCLSCANTPENAEFVLFERARMKEKNPGVFSSRIDQRSDGTSEHKRGCRCRKSRCVKKYCECFEGGVACTSKCRCSECLNSYDGSQGGPPEQVATAAGLPCAAAVTAQQVAKARTKGLPAPVGGAALPPSMCALLQLCTEDAEATAGSTGQVSDGHASGGQMSAGRMSYGQASAGQASAGQVSAGQTSAGQASAGHVSAGQASAGQASAGQVSASLGMMCPAAASRFIFTGSGLQPHDDGAAEAGDPDGINLSRSGSVEQLRHHLHASDELPYTTSDVMHGGGVGHGGVGHGGIGHAVGSVAPQGAAADAADAGHNAQQWQWPPPSLGAGSWRFSGKQQPAADMLQTLPDVAAPTGMRCQEHAGAAHLSDAMVALLACRRQAEAQQSSEHAHANGAAYPQEQATRGMAAPRETMAALLGYRNQAEAQRSSENAPAKQHMHVGSSFGDAAACVRPLQPGMMGSFCSKTQ